jgi:hypothetical protein
MPGGVRLSAMAIRFTALAKAILQTSRTQIAKFTYLRLDALTPDDEFRQGWDGNLTDSSADSIQHF